LSSTGGIVGRKSSIFSEKIEIMGGGVSKRKKNAKAEEPPEPQTKWVEHVYRIQDPDGNDFNITIGRTEDPELMTGQDLYPCAHDIETHISIAKGLPPGVFFLSRMIMDWTAPIENMDDPCRAEWPHRKSAQLKYEFIPLPKKWPPKKKFTLSMLNSAGRDRCEQYFFYDCHLDEKSPCYQGTQDGTLFTNVVSDSYENIALAMVGSNQKFSNEMFHAVEGEKKTPIWMKVCRRAEKLGCEMIKRGMLTRVELNATDIYDGTCLHCAIGAGFPRLAFEIICHPQVERPTLENADKISRKVPIEAARHQWGDGKDRTKKGNPVFQKLQKAIVHKVSKLKKEQHKRKLVWMRGMVGKKTVDTLQCPCGNVFMNDSKFCRKCGTPREAATNMQKGPKCACGNVFMNDSKFCRKCGASRDAVENPGAAAAARPPPVVAAKSPPPPPEQPPTPEANKTSEQPTASTVASYAVAQGAALLAAYSSITPEDSEI
jgi:hypothetical protein